jgi:pyruvate dehydrogenase E2 component (dihydrolipoamide acetyltransferase)
MSIEIIVPPLSQTMDSLVLVQWVKKTGDPVEKGETLFTVETDKATLEVEAPGSGILQSITAQPGDEIKVRSVIGLISQPGEKISPPSSFPFHGEETPSSSPSQAGVLPPTPSYGKGQGEVRLFASPRARRLAAANHITLADLKGGGTGPQGAVIERDIRSTIERQKAMPRITPVARRVAEEAGVDLATLGTANRVVTRADVQSVIEKQSGSGTPVTPVSRFARTLTLSPTRKTIARRMMQSHLESAPVTYMSEVDATHLFNLRSSILETLSQADPRPTLTDFLVNITARVLAKYPEFNATLTGETLQVFEAVHISLAVDGDKGITAPVLRDVRGKGVLELARMRMLLLQQVHEDTLKPEDLAGGTFTLTNLGADGVDFFTPIINPPQVAVLGVGRLREAPAVYKGEICIRRMLGLSLTCDHRTIDGAPAARFLREVCSLVEKPELVWL